MMMFNKFSEWKDNTDLVCMLTASKGLKPVWITHYIYFIWLDLKDLFKKK